MYTTLLGRKNLSIAPNHQPGYLHLEWIGFSEGKELSDLTREVLRAVAAAKSTRTRSDKTNWRAIAPNDHGWAANT